MVSLVDLVGDNGVVHVIDVVLIPNTNSNSVYDIISLHSYYIEYYTACSLDGTIWTWTIYYIYPTDAW